MTIEARERRQAASDLLFAHWQAGTVLRELPPDLRPTSRPEAYAIQALLERRSAHRLFGWKIAATSAAGQAHINVDGPLAGRLLRENVVADGVPVSLGANRMRVAEIEFAFRMSDDLTPRSDPFSEAEVLAAVDELFLAVEVPDSRYEDFCAVGAAQLVADDACADRFVLGPAAHASWRQQDLARLGVTGHVIGGAVHEGSGANVLGDPKTALTWLANELSRHGDTLGAGQVVTTGTCVVPLPVASGDVVVGDFGDLGRIRVAFGP